MSQVDQTSSLEFIDHSLPTTQKSAPLQQSAFSSIDSQQPNKLGNSNAKPENNYPFQATISEIKERSGVFKLNNEINQSQPYKQLNQSFHQQEIDLQKSISPFKKNLTILKKKKEPYIYSRQRNHPPRYIRNPYNCNSLSKTFKQIRENIHRNFHNEQQDHRYQNGYAEQHYSQTQLDGEPYDNGYPFQNQIYQNNPPFQAYAQNWIPQPSLVYPIGYFQQPQFIQMEYLQQLQFQIQQQYQHIQLLNQYYSYYSYSYLQQNQYPPQVPQHQTTPPTKPSPLPPKNFGKICLPRYEITINNCILQVVCCKVNRISSDMLIIPFINPDEFLYPGLKTEDYWFTKQKGESFLKGLKELRNGEVSYQMTQLSVFKCLALMKVPPCKDSSFNPMYNTGITSTLSKPSINDCLIKSVSIPYTNEFGSTKFKFEKILSYLQSEQTSAFERITVVCEDSDSFTRMGLSFNKKILDLGSAKLITY